MLTKMTKRSPLAASARTGVRQVQKQTTIPVVNFDRTRNRMRVGKNASWAASCVLTMAASLPAAAVEPASIATPRESMNDAWWTGPLLAASASTFPKGHLLFEPYIYDSIPYARVDSHGASHHVRHENDLRSLSYLNYGLAERFT